MKRRNLLAGLIAGPVASRAAFAVATPTAPMLDRAQSQAFRDWFTLLIHTQIERGPTPRWTHRDCAGLVRFAVAETLREHDLDWKRANSMLGTRVPPDIAKPQALALRNGWRRVDGSRDAYVGALELVQENTRFTGKELTQAQAGDLLFFDLGDEQHLMVWMGRYIAYHTGRSTPTDNGLRALRASQLLEWTDTRWRPAADNPNFSGLYRLSFLAR
ncbi:DUF1175 family protein [Roseateles sp.]|uniref:DUF1175 family protein n=1 Tax=Roseateles sp. TaxID=1971397 RepID=UPI003264C882